MRPGDRAVYSRYPDRSARPYVARACSRSPVLAARPWRAEGAPLMIVKKILTASVWRPSDRPRRRPGYGYSGQSNRAQIARVVLSPSIPHSSATARTMSNPWCRVGSIIPWFQGPPLSWTSIRA